MRIYSRRADDPATVREAGSLDDTCFTSRAGAASGATSSLDDALREESSFSPRIDEPTRRDAMVHDAVLSPELMRDEWSAIAASRTEDASAAREAARLDAERFQRRTP